MKNTVSLKKNVHFLRVYRKGKKSYNKYYALHYINNGLTYNRLGIKTSKKLAGAVKRNRIRRLIKESYRLSEDRIKAGYDIVIVPGDAAVLIDSYSEASRAIIQLLESVGLIYPA